MSMSSANIAAALQVSRVVVAVIPNLHLNPTLTVCVLVCRGIGIGIVGSSVWDSVSIARVSWLCVAWSVPMLNDHN